MHLPAILPWGAAEGFSKQMLLVILSVVIIATFFVLAARKQQLVPGKLQFAGEMPTASSATASPRTSSAAKTS